MYVHIELKHLDNSPYIEKSNSIHMPYAFHPCLTSTQQKSSKKMQGQCLSSKKHLFAWGLGHQAFVFKHHLELCQCQLPIAACIHTSGPEDCLTGPFWKSLNEHIMAKLECSVPLRITTNTHLSKRISYPKYWTCDPDCRFACQTCQNHQKSGDSQLSYPWKSHILITRFGPTKKNNSPHLTCLS